MYSYQNDKVYNSFKIFQNLPKFFLSKTPKNGLVNKVFTRHGG